MARPKKQPPISVFEQNIDDARQLLAFAEGLANYRVYRMRKELREAIGAALRYRKKDRDTLDCIESNDAFLIIKPDSDLSRDDFTEEALRPLLRQSVVAIAAAVETYVADRAAELVSDALRQDPLPKRMRELALNLGDVMTIEGNYERRRWGYRALVIDHLRNEASAAASKVGMVFSTVGVEKLWPAVDKERGVSKGTSAAQLDLLAERRNQIAHSADRLGNKRASLSIGDVDGFYENTYDIVEAIEKVL